MQYNSKEENDLPGKDARIREEVHCDVGHHSILLEPQLLLDV